MVRVRNARGHDMNGCIDSSASLMHRPLDETVEALVPAVEGLLQRIAPDEVVAREPDEGGFRLATPVRFPDGIGRGLVVARVFRYRDTVRVDIEIEHNRVLAKPDGTPSERRCYLNDYVATVTPTAEASELPAEFVQSVLRGVRNAVEAVQRHNKAQRSPWGQIGVVVA